MVAQKRCGSNPPASVNMQLLEHCLRAKERFGSEFRHVHKWLDEFYGHPTYKTKHRKFRHHWAGINEVRTKWGDIAADVAKQHILDDLRALEDKNADEYFIPKDEEDYVKRGYW